MLLEEKRVLREIRDVLGEIRDVLCLLVAELAPPQSTTAVLGGPMSLEVGATGPATATFTAATGAPAAPPTGDGSGITVTFSIDNTAIATVGPATGSGDEATAIVTAVSAGTYNLSAAVANSSGAVLLDNDGVTDFVQPAAVPGTVTAPPAPQAVTAVLTTP